MMTRIIYVVYASGTAIDPAFLKRCDHIVYIAFGETSTAVFFSFDEEKAEEDLYLDDYLKELCPEKPIKLQRLARLY